MPIIPEPTDQIFMPLVKEETGAAICRCSSAAASARKQVNIFSSWRCRRQAKPAPLKVGGGEAEGEGEDDGEDG